MEEQKSFAAIQRPVASRPIFPNPMSQMQSMMNPALFGYNYGGYMYPQANYPGYYPMPQQFMPDTQQPQYAYTMLPVPQQYQYPDPEQYYMWQGENPGAYEMYPNTAMFPQMMAQNGADSNLGNNYVYK